MAVVRAMTITYGTVAVPGTLSGANLELHGVHQLTKGRDTAEVVYTILVDGLGSASTLEAASTALETTFRTRRLKLTVDVAGSEILVLDPADFTGIDVTPTIRKPGDVDPPQRVDTNTSRLYEITITAGLTTLGTGGRRDFSFTVSFSASRRGRLEVRGTYTATEGGGAASVVYLASISARIATIVSGLGGTWELVSEDFTPDDEDGVVVFTRVLREVLFNQAGGGLDNPALVDPNLRIRRGTVSAEGQRTATPLLTLTAEYATSVDHDVNTDLVSVWETIARPFVFEQLESVAGGAVAIVSSEPAFNFYEHTLTATVIAESLGASTVLELDIETVNEASLGKIVRETWPRPEEVADDEEAEEPRPTPAHVYQGPRVITRTITTRTVESVEVAEGGANRNQRSAVATTEEGLPRIVEGFVVDVVTVLMSRRTRSRRRDRGIQDLGITIPLLEREVVEVFRLVVDVPTGDDPLGGISGPGILPVGAAAGEGGSGGR